MGLMAFNRMRRIKAAKLAQQKAEQTPPPPPVDPQTAPNNAPPLSDSSESVSDETQGEAGVDVQMQSGPTEVSQGMASEAPVQVDTAVVEESADEEVAPEQQRRNGRKSKNKPE